VSREDIARGTVELGVADDAHLQTCIDAIRAEKDRLGV
jgi:predicted hydrolase (HD superfamily)